MPIDGPMPAFKIWDVIKVPFPYTDRPVREWRPALVVATSVIQERHGLLWAMMITSSENRGWPGDVAISDLGAAGLPAPSVVRTAKIATIEAKEAERIGALVSRDRAAVRGQALSILSDLGKTPRRK
jgi:mRNA interferase MazF